MIIKLFKLINYIRLFIVNSIFLIIILILIVSFSDQEETVRIAENSYLKINLDGYIVEQKSPINVSQQISDQLAGGNEEIAQEFELQEFIQVIAYAQHDPKIKGIILELSALRSGSLDQLSDIGEALIAFKSTQKKVFAYSNNYSQSQYYLASYADEVMLPPNGFVLLQGYSVSRLYFKELIDKLLITPHIFKVGTYKSFVEPFTDTKMSQHSKEANNHWLNQLWQTYIDNVLAQRKDVHRLNSQSINPTLAELKQAVQAVSGDSAKYALNAGLVDQLIHYEQFITDLKEDDKFTYVDYQKYASIVPSFYVKSSLKDQIAVIHGSGEIISGHSDGSTIADQSFNHLLKQALKDDQIKAVVIRLDTPGGSAFASENIRQQVLALKNADKKVVISMGSVTASGGYWIAAAADKIVATPTTLTGSIGIFGMFATINKSLNKIGIHEDGISTNPLSDLGLTQPLDPKLAEIFQLGIENGYQNFLDVVADGRGMNVQDVNNIAQGRVWTGVDALENGLVDELGNLQSAISIAGSIANLTDYDVIAIKPELSSKQAFINEIFSASIEYLPTGSIKQSSLAILLSQLDKETNFVTRFNDPQNRFVFCTLCNVQ
ncbi:signal peptide peptidase SppA [Psychromonas sp.]|nr:signal peptide peptidase SppA [Psychromonas sp.]